MISNNGDKWTTLNTVTSVGNSTEYTEYIIWDVNYQPIINYYQLIQYDFDGEFEIFGPIAIDNRTLEQRIIKYTNLLGQEINPLNVKGIIIETYEDGSIRKVFRP